jgi:hypothetical protein
MSTKTKSNNSNQLAKKFNLQMTVKVGNDVINFTHEQAERYFQLKEQAKMAKPPPCFRKRKPHPRIYPRAYQCNVMRLKIIS